MTARALVLAAALAGCCAGGEPPRPAPARPQPSAMQRALAECPPPPPAPAPLPRVLPSAQLAQLAADLEAARQAERRRGDACAAMLRVLAAHWPDEAP